MFFPSFHGVDGATAHRYTAVPPNPGVEFACPSQGLRTDRLCALAEDLGTPGVAGPFPRGHLLTAGLRRPPRASTIFLGEKAPP